MDVNRVVNVVGITAGGAGVILEGLMQSSLVWLSALGLIVCLAVAPAIWRN